MGADHYHVSWLGSCSAPWLEDRIKAYLPGQNNYTFGDTSSNTVRSLRGVVAFRSS
jgi:hypothetical protein